MWEETLVGLNAVTWCCGGGGARLPLPGPGAFITGKNCFGYSDTELLQKDAHQHHVSLLSIPASGIRKEGSASPRSSSAYY